MLGGGLQGGGRSHGQEVLAGGGGVSRGRGTCSICMVDVGGYVPGRGSLCPFVEGRGPRRQQGLPVRRGQVRQNARCVDSTCGCAGGPNMTSCSAAATVRRLVPVLST